MNSIRIKSESEYIIEVNDKGECISFDTQDTSLTGRLMKAFEKIDSLTKEYEDKAAEIDARPDEPLNEFITKNQYDGAQLIDSFYIEARTTMDLFLGAGACQKIFGDKNYINMFNDLIEQLKPHFEQIGINAEKLKTSAVNKHMPNRETRRALK